MDKKRVVIIGGGASGLMASIAAAENGAAVTILEQNEKPGKKICSHRKRKMQFHQSSRSRLTLTEATIRASGRKF